MKSSVLFFLILLVSNNVFSQNEKIKTYFQKSNDTITSGINKEVNYPITIIIPKQKSIKKAYIYVDIEKNDVSPNHETIYLPINHRINLDNLSDTIQKTFILKFQQDDKNDRILSLKLKAKDSLDKELSLESGSTSCKIYIKPRIILDTLKDGFDKGAEFWIFTGTNLDLLDGAKVSDLYAKINWLFKTDDFWLNLSFTRNRFISDTEQFSRLTFSDLVLKNNNKDSLTIVNGFYDSKKTTITNNYALSILTYFPIKSKNQIFFGIGSNLTSQNIKYNFQNTILLTDTTKIVRKDSIRYNPLLNELKFEQYNLDAGISFLHIYREQNINIKTMAMIGINKFIYPRTIIRNNFSQFINFDEKIRTFVNLRLDVVVLKPGISINIETFIRARQDPLFNISLNKVFNINKFLSLLTDSVNK